MKRPRSLILAMLLATACSSPGAVDTISAAFKCTVPPASELRRVSRLGLSVAPNPVEAGARATLRFEGGNLPPDTITGAGAFWQCWNETTWQSTHQIVKGFGPETNEIAPGATVTVPAVGLLLPRSDEIDIPDVAPGTYRIADEALTEGNATIPGFVLVEVVSAGG